MENNKRWRALYSDIEKDIEARRWDDAIRICHELIREASGYKNVYQLLEKAERTKKRETNCQQAVLYFKNKLRDARQMLNDLWRKLPFRTAWGKVVAVLGVVFTITGLIFANQLATVGDSITKWWHEIRATPTPTVASPGVDSIEVWMDGGQLNLDRLPSLTSGEAVVLEVFVVDTNGKTYTSDDLKCKWSVTPLGGGDVGINTNLCKTLHIPSQEHSSQTVSFEVEGLEGQFEPSDPISMKFDIIK